MKLTVVQFNQLYMYNCIIYIRFFLAPQLHIHNNMFILGTDLQDIKPGTSVGAIYNG